MEEPGILYPIGAVLEDQTARLQVERFHKDRHGHHLYYCKILEWKVPIPQVIKDRQDTNYIWLWIRPDLIEKIKQLS